nr:hypothetical protein [Tanacetum cinerariifolium]
QIQTIVSSTHQKTQTPRQALNEDTELPQTSVPISNVPNKAVYKEWDDSVEKATTTAASLDATQDSGNILKTQSMAMPDVPLPQGISTDAANKKVNTYTRRRAVSTGSEGVSTSSRIFSTAEESVSTAGESMPVSTVDVVQEGIKDKGLQHKLLPLELSSSFVVSHLVISHLILVLLLILRLLQSFASLNFLLEDLIFFFVPSFSIFYSIGTNEDLVKERFITTEPTDDKEKALWVELKRLFELDDDDIL